MRKIIFISSLLMIAFTLLFVDYAMAGAGWKQQQVKMFSELKVQPGDEINSSNWENLKELLPPSMVEWVKRGDLIVKIGEMKYDLGNDPEWEDATANNEGKYALDDQLEVIDKGTGEYPQYIYGEPFPDIDWKNDPNAGIKIMHNNMTLQGRVGNFKCVAITLWVGRNGVERDLSMDYSSVFFWGVPGGAKSNPQNLLNSQLVKILTPYDLSGMVTLNNRYIEPKPDDYYAYLPSIRRVKKMSAANRSDPFCGSDFVNDDGNGWAGKNTSMKWKVLDRKISLLGLTEFSADHRTKCPQQPDGSFLISLRSGEDIKSGFDTPGSTIAPWNRTNVVYVPRMIYVIEAEPVDRYYNYGKMIFYVDPEAGVIQKIIFDKADQYWKTLEVHPIPYELIEADGDVRMRVSFEIAGHTIVDDKTDHASVNNVIGTTRNVKSYTRFMDPTLTPSKFTVFNLATESR